MSRDAKRAQEADLEIQFEQARPSWRTSSFCSVNGACVEFAELPGRGVVVRDGKHPAGPVLRFSTEEWRAFVAGVLDGEFSI